MDHLELTGMRAGVIGAGRLGRVLGEAVVAAGIPLVAASSRGESGRLEASQRLEIPVVPDLGEVAQAADLVLLCVPDRAIGEVAQACADAIGSAASERRRWFAHTSGCVGLEALAPLAAAGHGTFAIHPLQTVTPGAPADQLAGIPAAITALDEAGWALGHALGRAIGMVPFDLAARDRARYHAAATLAANGTTTIVAAALDLARGTGLGEDEATHAFVQLARAALDRLEAEGAGAALTGPVSRGDSGTVAAHVAAIACHEPLLLDLYRALAATTARNAAAADRIDPFQRRALAAVLA